MRGAWQGIGLGSTRRRGSELADIAEFDSVGLRYGTGAEVLRDLDFRLRQGGFYFLTGPSGAGKTSLLKLLYLAQRPTRGRIRLFGDELTEAPREALPQYRRRIGVVFQDFRLIRHLSAFDNVALPLRVAGASEEDVEGSVRETSRDPRLARGLFAHRRDGRSDEPSCDRRSQVMRINVSR